MLTWQKWRCFCKHSLWVHLYKHAWMHPSRDAQQLLPTLMLIVKAELSLSYWTSICICTAACFHLMMNDRCCTGDRGKKTTWQSRFYFFQGFEMFWGFFVWDCSKNRVPQQRAETTKAPLCEYCTCCDSLDAFILVTHFKSAPNHFLLKWCWWWPGANL